MSTQNSSARRRSGSGSSMPPARCCGGPVTRTRPRAPSRSPSSTAPATTTGRCPRAKWTPARPHRWPRCGKCSRRPVSAASSAGGSTPVSYPIDQGIKKVHYWAARSTGGEFAPGNEVDELVWLPVADAMKKLDYAQDRKVLRRFAKQPADTQTVLVVRHGTAGSKSRYLRRRHQAAVGQTRTRASRGAGWPTAGVRRHRRVRRRPGALPSDGGTARRRAGCAHPQRARPDRGGLRQEPQTRPPPRCCGSPSRQAHR